MYQFGQRKERNEGGDSGGGTSSHLAAIFGAPPSSSASRNTAPSSSNCYTSSFTTGQGSGPTAASIFGPSQAWTSSQGARNTSKTFGPWAPATPFANNNSNEASNVASKQGNDIMQVFGRGRGGEETSSLRSWSQSTWSRPPWDGSVESTVPTTTSAPQDSSNSNPFKVWKQASSFEMVNNSGQQTSEKNPGWSIGTDRSGVTNNAQPSTKKQNAVETQQQCGGVKRDGSTNRGEMQAGKRHGSRKSALTPIMEDSNSQRTSAAAVLETDSQTGSLEVRGRDTMQWGTVTGIGGYSFHTDTVDGTSTKGVEDGQQGAEDEMMMKEEFDFDSRSADQQYRFEVGERYKHWPLLGEGRIGECFDMCPRDEENVGRRSNVKWNNIQKFELPPLDEMGKRSGRHLRDLMVTRFQRSAAGQAGAGGDYGEEGATGDNSTNIRHPGALLGTASYLFSRSILEADKLQASHDVHLIPFRVPQTTITFFELHKFLLDRTRAIRRDFASQNYRRGGRNDPLVIDVHERIVRYHALAAYELCEHDSFHYQGNKSEGHTNHTEMNNTLKTLDELYDDAYERAYGAALNAYRMGKYESTESAYQNMNRLESPHEAEFRSLLLLLYCINDPESHALNILKKLPERILSSKEIKLAIRALRAASTRRLHEFVRLMKRASPLQAIFMQRSFRTLQRRVLMDIDGMVGAHNQKNKTTIYVKMDDLKKMLCAASTNEIVEILKEQEFDNYEVTEGEIQFFPLKQSTVEKTRASRNIKLPHLLPHVHRAIEDRSAFVNADKWCETQMGVIYGDSRSTITPSLTSSSSWSPQIPSKTTSSSVAKEKDSSTYFYPRTVSASEQSFSATGSQDTPSISRPKWDTPLKLSVDASPFVPAQSKAVTLPVSLTSRTSKVSAPTTVNIGDTKYTSTDVSTVYADIKNTMNNIGMIPSNEVITSSRATTTSSSSSIGMLDVSGAPSSRRSAAHDTKEFSFEMQTQTSTGLAEEYGASTSFTVIPSVVNSSTNTIISGDALIKQGSTSDDKSRSKPSGTESSKEKIFTTEDNKYSEVSPTDVPSNVFETVTGSSGDDAGSDDDYFRWDDEPYSGETASVVSVEEEQLFPRCEIFEVDKHKMEEAILVKYQQAGFTSAFTPAFSHSTARMDWGHCLKDTPRGFSLGIIETFASPTEDNSSYLHFSRSLGHFVVLGSMDQRLKNEGTVIELEYGRSIHFYGDGGLSIGHHDRFLRLVNFILHDRLPYDQWKGAMCDALQGILESVAREDTWIVFCCWRFDLCNLSVEKLSKLIKEVCEYVSGPIVAGIVDVGSVSERETVAASLQLKSLVEESTRDERPRWYDEATEGVSLFRLVELSIDSFFDSLNDGSLRSIVALWNVYVEALFNQLGSADNLTAERLCGLRLPMLGSSHGIASYCAQTILEKLSKFDDAAWRAVRSFAADLTINEIRAVLERECPDSLQYWAPISEVLSEWSSQKHKNTAFPAQVVSCSLRQLVCLHCDKDNWDLLVTGIPLLRAYHAMLHAVHQCQECRPEVPQKRRETSMTSSHSSRKKSKTAVSENEERHLPNPTIGWSRAKKVRSRPRNQSSVATPARALGSRER
eukprot:gb/GECG01014511.1/.p1 GENE.gb/GECG01014511.1/~~gb/GECG01014511.1/.p1  ORF type:complete len:1593 (+),score=238.59 gb/GECG01014511.1/:1-4779(+)